MRPVGRPFSGPVLLLSACTLAAPSGAAEIPYPTEHTIAAASDGAFSVATGDLDGDGDPDVLGAASIGDSLGWFENTAGDGSASTEHTVDAAFTSAESVTTADVDGDGDLDIVGGGRRRRLRLVGERRRPVRPPHHGRRGLPHPDRRDGRRPPAPDRRGPPGAHG